MEAGWHRTAPRRVRHKDPAQEKALEGSPTHLHWLGYPGYEYLGRPISNRPIESC